MSACTSIEAFDGVFGKVTRTYKKWTANLVLQGGNVQIRLSFDRGIWRRDFLETLENKHIAVVGYAFYVGESAIPKRIKVITHEALLPPRYGREIYGALRNSVAQLDEWN